MPSLKKFVLLNLSIFFYLVTAFFILGVVGSYLTKFQMHSLKNINQFVFLILVWEIVKYSNKNILNVNRSVYFSLKPIDIIFFFMGIIISIILFLLSLKILIGISPNEKILFLNLKIIAKFAINNLLVSFNEELLFRCLIFFSLLRIINNVFLSAIVSSIYFVIFHYVGMKESNLIFLGNIFLGGMLLCYLYYVSNSIWIAIGLHLSNNVINLIVEFSPDINGYTNRTYTLIYSIFLAIILATIIMSQQKWKSTKLSKHSY